MESIAFTVIGALAFLSLWGIHKSGSAVRAISCFGIFTATIAMIFGLLRAPFLAVGQLVIFTGGMIALLLIGISFSVPDAPEKESGRIVTARAGMIPRKTAWYGVIALFLLAAIVGAIPYFLDSEPLTLAVQTLAMKLFGNYWPLIPLFLLMFLAALLSAVYFLKRDNSEP